MDGTERDERDDDRVPAGAVVGVVGAGTMGAGVAEVAARAGHPVLLLDADAAVATRAVGSVVARLDRDVDAGRLDADVARTVASRLRAVAQVEDLAAARLVVECVVERLDAKQQVLRQVEQVVDDDALLATNTSSLSVTAVAAGLRRPGRVVGLHFFNPAPRMDLVEVVRGEDSRDDVVATALALVRSWGKTPVTCTSTPGFVVNRVARPYYGEAQRVVEERTAEPATVDLVLREVGGFPMGPFELTDLVGQDVNLAVSRSVWEQTFGDPRYAPTVLQQRLVDARRLGRKTGRGVYDYADDADPAHRPRPELPSAPHHPAPPSVVYREGWSVMSPLLERVRAAGVDVRDGSADGPDCTDELGVLLPSGGRLVETSGLRTLDVGEDVVLLDWAFDPARTARVAVAVSPASTDATVREALGLLQAAGVEVTVLGDGPGLVVARTVAMLVNEAVALVDRGEASADDVDTSMRLGTGYPAGPLEWGEQLGAACVADVVDGLHHTVPTGRYRVAAGLRLAAETGSPLRS